MIFGYKKALPGSDQYWFGDFDDGMGTIEQKQFIRVCAGLVFPRLERSNGAVVAVAELLRPSGPQDFTMVAASIGLWPQLQNDLVQFRVDLKFNRLITEPGRNGREMIWRIPQLRHAETEIPPVTYDAPKLALEDMGRQQVEALIQEKRLTLDAVPEIRDVLDQDPQVGGLALECAIAWMIDNKPMYAANQAKRRPLKAVWGLQGL